MLRVGPYLFKQADSDNEFDQIHRLNYRTFVNEIRQYSDPGTGRLIDKFHHKNIYFVGLKHDRVVGMLSAHDQPPFSISERLPDPSVLQRPGMDLMEVRLLAVEPDERHSSIFFGLVYVMYHYALKKQKTHLVISGVSQRLRLYQRLGFAPIGPAIDCGQASFVPMILDVTDIPEKMQRMKVLWESHVENQLREDKSEWESDHSASSTTGWAMPTLLTPPEDQLSSALAEAEICLLPGPVTVRPEVRQAFYHPPIYHRGSAFIRRFAAVRQTLSNMVRGQTSEVSKTSEVWSVGPQVAILNGSGTLANEAVAANLSAIAWPGRGVLLVNGEFGERLVRQAARFGLRPRVLRWEWGQPWDLEEIDDVLAREQAGWIWGVHQESSTGILNDLPGLVHVAKKYETAVCVDCISSLGAVPLDLREVFLATGSSGKSLGSYAGASIVFADPKLPELVDTSKVPSYFDLVAALASDGPCYTFPSPTLLALEAALTFYQTPEKAQRAYERYARLGAMVREKLRRLGLPPLAHEDYASPVVTTFAPPGDESAVEFVERCLSWGIAIGGQSGYLARERLVQIATMGDVSVDMCDAFFNRLAQHLSAEPALAGLEFTL